VYTLRNEKLSVLLIFKPCYEPTAKFVFAYVKYNAD